MTVRKIRAHVEMGIQTVTEYLDLPDGWDDWEASRRDAYLVETAVTLQNNEAPCGACVVEVDENDREIRVVDDNEQDGA
ncbi:hypothetical protein E1264_17860 [Actinomadura sp. KC216]|uniref:hypothetical protein n=1 Tax=Actinomadura sp. KC216 TaxID=2530370 RepID=UPI001045002C|nr:hypothetical protein [Actinomadura sp. KC216]TDB86464.1 hypothetical protein E1264_17860 [Actinomadura sp. KC216]